MTKIEELLDWMLWLFELMVVIINIELMILIIWLCPPEWLTPEFWWQLR